MALQSDYRVRGISISEERPVAAVSVAYDHPSGVYVGGTAVGAVRHGDPELVSVQGIAGYATRISRGLSLDGGVSRFEYFGSYGSAGDYHYTEFYIGLATRQVAGRVRYSPDYFSHGNETIYAEADAGLEVAPNWLVNAHVGVLHYLDEQPATQPKRRYDWRVGVTRTMGPYGFHIDVSGRLASRVAAPAAPSTNNDRTALVASLTRAF